VDAETDVSVVIPTYNRSDRLEGAIRSALDQEPKPHEIIVVDDGSTDGTDRIQLTSIDPCIRVIRHESNRGGGAARNTGIDAARGKWIAFLDADDLWLPGKLALQLAQINKAGEEKVFACGNVVFEGRIYDGQLYNSRPPYNGEDISRYFLLHGCTFQTSTLLVPSDLAREVRFDERLRRHQDWDFSLRLLKYGAHFVYSHQALAKYWDEADPNRVSKQSSIEPALFWIRSARELIAPDAAAAFYFRTTFRQHVVQQPTAALVTAVKLTFQSPGAACWALKKLATLLVGRVHSA
jgi:glycosyltransferase involved in cell wall biosynthesis